MNNKNLLHFIADWLEEKRTGQPNAVRVNDWLPTLGNIVFTLLIAFTLVFTQQAWATPQAAVSTVNPTINYQGRLADSGGVPVDGNVAMSFAIFDASSGGNLMWGPESHPTVPVADGLFNVGLGSLTGGGIPATVWQGGDRYLQITVAGETLAPREMIRSVPSAGIAEHSLTTDVAEHSLSSNIALTISSIRQDNNMSGLEDRIIMSGWGFVQGNEPIMAKTIQFSHQFAEPPIVVTNYIGVANSSLPSVSITDFNDNPAIDKVISAHSTKISATQFTVNFTRSINSYSPNLYYGYSWIAIGRPAP